MEEPDGGEQLAAVCSAWMRERDHALESLGIVIDDVGPGLAGDELTAIAQERSLRGRTGLYDVPVSNQAGEVVAHFRGRSHRVGGAVVRDTCTEAREDARNAGGGWT